MIPTYNPDDLLEQTIRSVLDQDPGPGRMEVVVVDDASPNGQAAAIVDRIGSPRVRFEAGPNVGIGGNWNRCIATSRGLWIHLLHQDDLVLPGFYERLERADVASPQPGMAICAHRVVDLAGNEVSGSLQFADQPGVVPGFLDVIAEANHLQCPAIVVRRAAYEALGGFRADLKFVLDWEMWVRLASEYPVWYDPTPLAHWRNHSGNESARLRRHETVGPDIRRGIAVVRQLRLPATTRRRAGSGLLRMIRDEQIDHAAERISSRHYLAALRAIATACQFDKTTLLRRRIWKKLRGGPR